MKYVGSNDEISTITGSPLNNLFHILTTLSIKLRNKCKVLCNRLNNLEKQ